MTISQPTPAGVVLVAIDIAKLRHEVLLELPGRQRRRRLTMLYTRPERDRIVACLQGFEAPIVVVGFEATGNYHRPLAHRLLGEGFELRLISSLALARTREALSNTWCKNDPKDARVILHMLRIGTSPFAPPTWSGVGQMAEAWWGEPRPSGQLAVAGWCRHIRAMASRHMRRQPSEGTPATAPGHRTDGRRIRIRDARILAPARRPARSGRDEARSDRHADFGHAHRRRDGDGSEHGGAFRDACSSARYRGYGRMTR